MRRFLQLLVVFVILAGRAVFSQEVLQDDPEREGATKADPSGRAYFPASFDNWYHKHLSAMGEPSLFSVADTDDGDQIRFLCLPTFSKPISFRSFERDGRFWVRVVRLTGQGGYEPGKIEIDSSIEITTQERTTLTEAVIKSTKECKLTDDQQSILSGLDGTQWILEARINGRYHFQEVWEPEYWTSEEGVRSLEELNEGMGGKYKLDQISIAPFRDACGYFLLLTDFRLPSRMVPAELKSEQGGAGQPATRSELDSEGGDKPQPKSEARSR
jgi:hypothetical protein